MDTVRKQLEHDLHTAIGRLRQLGGAVTAEALVGPTAVNSSFADEVDAIQASEFRDIGCTIRELLAERVNRLSAALDRLDKAAYGMCVECNEAISPARLHVMPEVQTCVRCQDRLERFDRQSGRKAMASQFDDAST
jgi:RNA polymerase-binding transcription factor DksA